ncbi:hypothetical protein COD07_19220 [Bacillus thuringiensis]|nr:hypothetical protein COD07_19220 [Bacillus thuringiensis]
MAISWMNLHVWAVTNGSVILGALINTFFVKKKEPLIKTVDIKSRCFGEYLKAFVAFSTKKNKIPRRE